MAELPQEYGLRKQMRGDDYVATYGRVYEILNLCNGRRSLRDVYRRVSCQFAGDLEEGVLPFSDASA